MALDILAWHDRTSADHQTQLNNARAAGYRTISLCVYGDRNDPRYAAAMVKRSTQTPEQQFISLSAADLQAKFNSMATQGFGPLIISGTGPTNNPLFAACFVPSASIPFTKFGITSAEFNSLNQAQIAGSLILRWADVYGDPGNLRYIGIWVTNTDNRAWNCDDVDDDYATLQARFNALVPGFARPVHAAATPDGGVLTLYEDSEASAWQYWAGMTSADYQAKFNTLYQQGLPPVRVSAKGTGSNARFSVIFAGQEDADPRTFRINGPSNSVAIDAIDLAMKAVMTANMIRGASLAIVSGTQLVYTRGYTFAEPGYPDVQPTTFFRQASVSKMFTAAAIYQLIDEGAKLPGTNTLLTLDTALTDALPNIANGTPVAHWSDITIRHLLEMTSGVTSSVLGTDPNVSSTLPVTALAMAEWLFRQPLGNTPGDKTKATYSNAGYMLLGMVVARMRGAADFVSGLATFLNKLQITRVRSALSVASAQHADEARYHSRPLMTERSVMVTGQPLCAEGYGGANLENCGGGGGLSAAATDVARVLAALSVTINNPMMSAAILQTWLQNAVNATSTLTGPEAHGYHGFDSARLDTTTNHFVGEKGGSLATSQNGVHFEINGISTVICWNGTTPVGPQWFGADGAFANLVNAAEAQRWGGTDFFPTFGMPSFSTKPAPLPIRPPRPLGVVPMPSHMLPQRGPRKNM